MIGIVGTGVMARGIAIQAALCKEDVILVGRNSERTGACVAFIKGQLTLHAGRHAQAATLSAEAGRAKVRATLDYADLAGCDAVIETIPEDLAVKQSVLRECERHVREDCLLLSCTSSISIAQLAASLARPGRFLGMHFFNPAQVMPLVELVPHFCTEPDAIRRADQLAIGLGKRPIVVRDTPGFFVNRVLFAYIEGFCTVLQDIDDFAKVDEVMIGSGWPMGPAALLDAIGIDTCFDIGRILVRAFPTVFSPAFDPVLAPLVAQGWTGKKSGIGFYRYGDAMSGSQLPVANKEVVGTWGDMRKGRARGDLPADEIVERLMLPMTNEVFRCLEEGVIATPEEADQAIFLSMGYGRKGGVCRQMKRTGVDVHLAKCGKHLYLGEIYQPPASLLAMAG